MNRERGPIIAKAFYRAADRLRLKPKDIEDVLGFSEPTISRQKQKIEQKEPVVFGEKENELALYLLRIFRSLDALFAGNEESMRNWFDSLNRYFEARPRDLVKTIGGLVNVAGYLDAMRGKV